MRVFVTGGTGLIGTRLIRRLRERQDNVVVLTRHAVAARERLGPDCTIVEGDPSQSGAWMDAARDCDAVINLAGESIFGRRWNDEVKAQLINSRIKSAEHVVQALTRNPTGANGSRKVLINASAAGYYGPRDDEELTEESLPGNDFLARICVEWEGVARQAESQGVRVVLLRIGVVLDREGGALTQMLTPFKLFAGGPVGSGMQWMSWIHHDDLVGILLLALDNASATGPINGTAPNPLRNREFASALGRVLHRPAFLPTPAFALRLMLGEVAQIVTTGQRVLPRRALELGYQFKFPTVDVALADVLA